MKRHLKRIATITVVSAMLAAPVMAELETEPQMPESMEELWQMYTDLLDQYNDLLEKYKSLTVTEELSEDPVYIGTNDLYTIELQDAYITTATRDYIPADGNVFIVLHFFVRNTDLQKRGQFFNDFCFKSTVDGEKLSRPDAADVIPSFSGMLSYPEKYSEGDIIYEIPEDWQELVIIYDDGESEAIEIGPLTPDSSILHQEDIEYEEPGSVQIAVGPEKTEIEKMIRDRINSQYDETVIDALQINDNGGTDIVNDYIAIVRLTWNRSNSGDLSKTMLTMYSDDLAIMLDDECPNVQEVAIFWTVPYLKDTAKCSYHRVNGRMEDMSMSWGPSFGK